MAVKRRAEGNSVIDHGHQGYITEFYKNHGKISLKIGVNDFSQQSQILAVIKEW